MAWMGISVKMCLLVKVELGRFLGAFHLAGVGIFEVYLPLALYDGRIRIVRALPD